MQKPIRNISMSILCGGDEECRSELNELVQLVAELDSVASGLPEPVINGSNGSAPIIERVENRERILEAASGILEGDEAISDYLLRRRLYLLYKGRVDIKEESQVCPICGSLPRIIRLTRAENALFAGYEARARCTCGYEWRVSEWRCPYCGVEGRENFRVYVAEPGVFEVRRCKRCGYKIAVVAGDLDQADVALVNLVVEGLRDDGGDEGDS